MLEEEDAGGRKSQHLLDEVGSVLGSQSCLGGLDRWADEHYRDSSSDLKKNWESTSKKLEGEIDDVVERDWRALQERLAEIQAEVNAAWSKVALVTKGTRSPHSTMKINPVWLDPAVKAGFSLAGGALGMSFGGPGGAVIGSAIGELVGLGVSKLFGSRRSQLDKRRGELHRQVMDANHATLTVNLDEWDAQVAQIVRVLEQGARQAEEWNARRLEVAASLERIAGVARRAVDRFDAHLVRDLLGLRGCAGVASGVGEVRRVPGGTTLVGLKTGAAFEESVVRRPRGVGDLRFYPCDGDSTPHRKIAQALRLGWIDPERSTKSGIDSSAPPFKIFLDVPVAALVNEQWVASAVSGEECTVVLASNRKG